MGIKHFFYWFKNTFPKNITEIYRNQTVQENIDVFLIDMNGIFHTAAQKIYMYGAYAPLPDILTPAANPPKPRGNGLNTQINVFKEVCKSLDALIAVVRPKKTLVLCVDGPAPIAKQCQQRKRRFMSSLRNDNCEFDSNAITPGTKFMNFLTKYIDWYIRYQISIGSPLYKNLEIIFSNEKVVGEGEHKCFAYLRKYGNNELKYCLHGMDADLIMLSLAANVENFFILRENQNSYTIDFYFINVGSFKKDLVTLMDWGQGKKFKPKRAVQDFIFMCFMVGNDFLPHIPAIEIITGGIDYMLETYKIVGKEFGHLTKKKQSCTLRKKALARFFCLLGKKEKTAFISKYQSNTEFIPDELLNSCIETKDGTQVLRLVDFRKLYFSKKFPDEPNIEKICHEYLKGMQWVLNYYVNGVSDWKYQYPYHYAPFASIMAKVVDSFVCETETASSSPSSPSLPFIQLLSVLPPKSASLLPEPLSFLLTDEKSPLIEFCPNEFEIDASGCRQEWEATVILPFVNFEKVENAYKENIKNVNPKELDRNKHGKSFIYKRGNKPQKFSSFYGDFVSYAVTEQIEL